MNVGDKVRPRDCWACGCTDVGTVEDVSKPEDLFDESMVQVSTPCGWAWVETTSVAPVNSTCFFCGGVAHPATGHRWTEDVLACRRCYEEFFAWYRARMNHNPIASAARGEYEGLKLRKKRRRSEVSTEVRATMFDTVLDLQTPENLEREKGFEPSTSTLAKETPTPDAAGNPVKTS